MKTGVWIRSALAVACGLAVGLVRAEVVTFFNAAQGATNFASGATSDTLRSGDYLFTYSLDKWWYPTISLGGGEPTGRFQSLQWPAGLHAQAITAGPAGLLTSSPGATVTVRRVDGAVFDVVSFEAKLLANTAGAGGAFEIMPLLGGIDGFPDPLMLDATGYAGNRFAYTTPSLVGFDTYHINLWVDFALIALTVRDSTVPPPIIAVANLGAAGVRLSWDPAAAGWQLESTTGLSPASWKAVTDLAPVAPGVVDVPSVVAGASVRYFRLRRP